MKLYVAPDGQEFTGIRPGETSENPISYDQLFLDGVLQPGLRIILLPGTYQVEQSLDLRPHQDIAVYADGKVTIDGLGRLEDAFRINNQHTVAGIRFRDVLARPVVIEDGGSECLVVNCFDYQFDENISAGQSFTARDVTSCTFKNLTSIRDGFGISILKGIEMYNCLAKGYSGPGRPSFLGEIVDLFDSTNGWVRGTPTVNFVAQMQPSGFYEGENQLFLGITNTGPSGHALGLRNLPPSEAIDISRANFLYLVVNLISVSDLVAGADSYRFVFESPAGFIQYDVADTALSAGLNVLAFDLGAPDASGGILDPADIRFVSVGANLNTNGTVQLGLDHLYALDSTAICDFNSVELFEGLPLLDRFKGTNGIDQDAYPPPFEGPTIERFNYNSELPFFREYVLGGRENCPIGALFNGSQLMTSELPGHLSFSEHPTIGPWTNDETFYDTSLGQPGPDAEGYAINIDENLYTYAPINGETVNLADTAVLGEIRDLDDAVGKKFDKNAGALSVMGVRATRNAGSEALLSAGAIDASGEYYLPPGALTDVLPAGLKIIARSPGGEIYQTKPAAELFDGWNEISVLFDSPEGSSGVFDPDDVTEIDVTMDVDNAANLVGHVVDHLHASIVSGPSTAPVTFGGNGAPIIDLNAEPEGQVARLLSDPILARNAGAFLRAAWCALENADDGALINSRPYQQDLGTRTIEVRYSEMRFARYGTLQGSLAKDWTPLSRLGALASPGVNLWVQIRMYLRNRTNVPVS